MKSLHMIWIDGNFRQSLRNYCPMWSTKPYQALEKNNNSKIGFFEIVVVNAMEIYNIQCALINQLKALDCIESPVAYSFLVI